MSRRAAARDLSVWMATAHPTLMSLAAPYADSFFSRARHIAAQLLVPALALMCASTAGAQATPPASTRPPSGNPAWKCQVDAGLSTTYGAASRACEAQFRAASIRAALIDGQSLGASQACAIRLADQVERATAAWAAADTVAALETERVDCDGRTLTTDSLSYDTRALLRVCPGKIWSWVDRGGAGQSCTKIRDFVVAARTNGATPHGASNEKDLRRGADLTREARDWYTRGEFTKAKDDARRAIGIDPGNALAHAVLGASQSMLGQHVDAEKELRAAVAMDAANAWAWGMLAQTLYFAEHDSAVMAVARDALAVDGGNAEVLGFLGMSQVRAGSTSDAITTLTRATSLAPRDARFRASLSRALRRAGKNDEAEAAARDAIRLQADYYGGYAELGQVLELKGQKAAALAAYKTAHKLADWDSEVTTRLSALEKP